MRWQDFDVAELAAAKDGRCISVCLPARDEEATVGAIVETLRALAERWALVDEVLVVDDGSTDRTAGAAAAAGATVVAAAEVLAGEGPGTGKGEALWKAVAAAKGDLLVFCDADLVGFHPGFVTGLLGPCLLGTGEGRGDVALVKGSYDRPAGGAAGGGGRVTELAARPLISLLFPHLAGIDQPLGGEFAARREVLEQVPFVEGYGVDLALLVDVAARFGVGAIAQVDLGVRYHRNRPLDELGPQALAVAHTALSRAGMPFPGEPVLRRPGSTPLGIAVGQRPPLVSVAAYRDRA